MSAQKSEDSGFTSGKVAASYDEVVAPGPVAIWRLLSWPDTRPTWSMTPATRPLPSSSLREMARVPKAGTRVPSVAFGLPKDKAAQSLRLSGIAGWIRQFFTTLITSAANRFKKTMHQRELAALSDRQLHDAGIDLSLAGRGKAAAVSPATLRSLQSLS